LFIPDLDPDFLPIPDHRIPDPGVNKAPDPGSGSATLEFHFIILEQVRVSKKSGVRQISTSRWSGTVADCILSDTSGDIKLTGFESQASSLDGLLEADATYTVSGAKIQPVRYRYLGAYAIGIQVTTILAWRDLVPSVRVTSSVINHFVRKKITLLGLFDRYTFFKKTYIGMDLIFCTFLC
jgi:hypothetical protein